MKIIETFLPFIICFFSKHLLVKQWYENIEILLGNLISYYLAKKKSVNQKLIYN